MKCTSVEAFNALTRPEVCLVSLRKRKILLRLLKICILFSFKYFTCANNHEFHLKSLFMVVRSDNLYE